LNEANPNLMGDASRELPLGDALNLVVRYVRGAVVDNLFVFPERSRPQLVVGAIATHGAAPGYKPIVPFVAPAPGQASLRPNGSLEFNAADAITMAEIQYIAFDGPVLEEEMEVVANVATFANGRGAVAPLEVEALEGGSVGEKTVVIRGTTPGVGEAAAQFDPTGVEFAAADAVTRARIKYVAQPGMGNVREAVGVSLDAVDKNY
jgi:hypothetical protein